MKEFIICKTCGEKVTKDIETIPILKEEHHLNIDLIAVYIKKHICEKCKEESNFDIKIIK